MDKDEIKKLISRIEKLEKAVFSQEKKASTAKASKTSDYSGPKGGTLFLIQKGYLDTRRAPKDVMLELEKHNYNYQLAVVRNTLSRLSSAKGPLTRLSVDGQFVYVKRK